MDKIAKYLETVSDLLLNAPKDKLEKISSIVLDAYRSGKQVFIMGNGGSAATATHLACDLQKSIGVAGKKQFKVMSLTDNTSLMTAWANDFEYCDIFSGQLATWVEPGDVVIGISGSGNSANVIKGIELANGKGATTIGLAGFDGGKLAKVAQNSIVVPSDNMQHIEDTHMVFSHLIFRYILDDLNP